jgi:hypothetical protein
MSQYNIRLVHLQPSKYLDIVKCEIARVNLNQHPCPEYEALSYEWGSSAFSLSITLGYRRVFIRENLH